MTNSFKSSPDPPPEIDKEAAYGEFLNTQRWRDKLAKKQAHMALDIPNDDMNISVRQGFGWKEILAVGTLGLGGWSAWLFSHQPPPPPIPTVTPPAFVDRDTTRRIDIEKYIPPK